MTTPDALAQINHLLTTINNSLHEVNCHITLVDPAALRDYMLHLRQKYGQHYYRQLLIYSIEKFKTNIDNPTSSVVPPLEGTINIDNKTYRLYSVDVIHICYLAHLMECENGK
jgi:hypothetical protein